MAFYHEVHTITQEVRIDQSKTQRLTRRVSQTMGRQRNTPQLKGKEKASERILTEKEASQLSDTEFKPMVIRKLTELSKLKETTRNYRETTMNSLQSIST